MHMIARVTICILKYLDSTHTITRIYTLPSVTIFTKIAEMISYCG